MVSKAIASLDAWLARAEEVLAEQREWALSPSLGPSGGSGMQEWTISLGALSGGLEGLLGSLCRRPGRWILIVEDERRRHHFWQALAYEDGSLVTETVSNRFLDDEEQWTAQEEDRLVELGWDPPVQPRRPNFIHVEYTTSPDVDAECRRAVATLRELFGLGDHDPVFVKLFSSTIREDTPASAQYTTEEDATPLPERPVEEDNGPIEDADFDFVCRCPATPAEDPAPMVRHYFRPNVNGSDEEMESDIEDWLETIMATTSDRTERSDPR